MTPYVLASSLWLYLAFGSWIIGGGSDGHGNSMKYNDHISFTLQLQSGVATLAWYLASLALVIWLRRHNIQRPRGFDWSFFYLNLYWAFGTYLCGLTFWDTTQFDLYTLTDVWLALLFAVCTITITFYLTILAISHAHFFLKK